MAATDNAAPALAWSGDEGQHWAANADRYDAVNSGFNQILLDAGGVGERDRVLDIGCGNGQLTRLAARRAVLAHAVGVDLAAPMLANASARAASENVANVSFRQADAQVYPFAQASFDVALSRFGVMFFADPVAAFANIRRALTPAGRLGFVCRTEFAGTDLGTVFDAIAPYRQMGPSITGPTSLADPARTRAVLSGAGFESVTCTHVEVDQIWGSDVSDAAEFMSGWGPLKRHIDQVGPDGAARARRALLAVLQTFAQPDAVRLRGTAWLVTARSPAAT